MNKVRAGTFLSIIFTAIIFILLAFMPGVDQSDDVQVQHFQKIMTILTWICIVPFFALGWLAGRQRLRHFNVTVLNKYK